MVGIGFYIYSDCQNNVPIGAISHCLGMGAYTNRRKFVTGLRGRPQIDYIKIVQADTINGFVRKTFLGLHGFHGCGYAAVDEGQVIIPAVRIRTHTQTERIYDIYYSLRSKFKELLTVKSG